MALICFSSTALAILLLTSSVLSFQTPAVTIIIVAIELTFNRKKAPVIVTSSGGRAKINMQRGRIRHTTLRRRSENCVAKFNTLASNKLQHGVSRMVETEQIGMLVTADGRGGARLFLQQKLVDSVSALTFTYLNCATFSFRHNYLSVLPGL